MRNLLLVVLLLFSSEAFAETIRYQRTVNGTRAGDVMLTYDDDRGSFRGFIDGQLVLSERYMRGTDDSWRMAFTYKLREGEMRLVFYLDKDKGPYYHTNAKSTVTTFDEESTHAGNVTIAYVGRSARGRGYVETISVLEREGIEKKTTCSLVVDDRNRFESTSCKTGDTVVELRRAGAVAPQQQPKPRAQVEEQKKNR